MYALYKIGAVTGNIFPLKKGDGNPYVLALQSMLNNLKGANLTEDGIFGTGTLNAVSKYMSVKEVSQQKFNVLLQNTFPFSAYDKKPFTERAKISMEAMVSTVVNLLNSAAIIEKSDSKDKDLFRSIVNTELKSLNEICARAYARLAKTPWISGAGLSENSPTFKELKEQLKNFYPIATNCIVYDKLDAKYKFIEYATEPGAELLNAVKAGFISEKILSYAQNKLTQAAQNDTPTPSSTSVVPVFPFTNNPVTNDNGGNNQKGENAKTSDPFEMVDKILNIAIIGTTLFLGFKIFGEIAGAFSSASRKART